MNGSFEKINIKMSIYESLSVEQVSQFTENNQYPEIATSLRLCVIIE